jgi:tetratricopeptide (TPR) repeat protein
MDQGRLKVTSTSQSDFAGRPSQSSVAPVPLGRRSVFFGVTLFVSAALLFVVQPMFAKMVLPLLGGAPAVWNTCLVFYQAFLLAGYLYAHLSLKWLGPRRQAAMHLVLLCLPWTVLPIGVSAGWLPPPGVFPVFWLWMLLSVSVGLPFLVVSASAPTLQAWFGQTEDPSAHDPYFLYAASNLGSLLALLGYPLLLESHLTLNEQAWAWAGGYGLLMALIAGCALQLWRSPAAGATVIRATVEDGGNELSARGLTARRRLRWLALSFVPSSLLLGVTTYISTDIAAIPLLWVIPLALYLFSFVLVFARRPIVSRSLMLRVEPYLTVAAVATLAWHAGLSAQLAAIGSLQLGAFFAIAMVCHGQLADDRPEGGQLTEFYLWMSFGGVLGGLFNALAAPLLFSDALEYPLMLVVACLLRPAWPSTPRPGTAWPRALALPAAVLLACGGLAGILRWQAVPMESGWADVPAVKLAIVLAAAAAAFCLRRRALSFSVGVASLLAIGLGYPSGVEHLLHKERSFFGVLRVADDPVWNAHKLLHGSTCHGCQGLDPAARREPWTYYSRTGPLGQIFQALQTGRPLAEIGVLGLGAGSIAAYGQPGERITFYEIDPAVERIARDPRYFTYLADSRARIEVILGDARLSLAHGPSRQFDLLVLDVFSSDSVPIHLVTREAIRLYLQRLAERHGLLAIHVSSRYLDLAPILGRLAQDAGATALIRSDTESAGLKKLGSLWIVMAQRPEDLAPLAGNPAWQPLRSDGGRVWTDDFSDVLSAFRWGGSWDWLRPSAWWRSKEDWADFYVSQGSDFYSQGRWDDAIAQFQKALEIAPDEAGIHNNLAIALQGGGRTDEAIAQYAKALELQPNSAGTHDNLGVLFAQQRKVAEGIAHFRKSLQLDPHQEMAIRNLNVALAPWGGLPKQAVPGDRSGRWCPDDVALLNNVAWVLATSADASIRDGAEAVALAERAVTLSQGRQPAILATLAAAYAEAGRFAEALQTAEGASAMAAEQHQSALAESIKAKLTLYRAGLPFRESPASSSTNQPR